MRRMDELHLEFPFAGARMLQGLLAVAAGRIPPSPRPATGSIRICCVALRSIGRTRCGRWTSPTAHGARLHLSRRRHGLVQPPGSVVACVDHDGGGILRRGVGGGAGPSWQSSNLQHGPGQPVRSFTDVLVEHQIAISMDGRGSWRENVFLERFWRSVKYEEVYLRAYDSVDEARASLSRYIHFYNSHRPHSSLDGRTPDQAYFNSLPFRAAA